MRVMMSIGAAVAVAALGLTAGNAFAKSEIQKECSTKYQAAKAANQLNGQNWNQFYKTCAAEAKVDKTAAPSTPAPAPAPAPTKTAKKPPATAPAAAGAAVFPAAISPEFSKESPGKGRFKTCVAQYNANKAKNANGGLVWLSRTKGAGSYWPECNKHLKG